MPRIYILFKILGFNPQLCLLIILNLWEAIWIFPWSQREGVKWISLPELLPGIVTFQSSLLFFVGVSMSSDIDNINKNLWFLSTELKRHLYIPVWIFWDLLSFWITFWVSLCWIRCEGNYQRKHEGERILPDPATVLNYKLYSIARDQN